MTTPTETPWFAGEERHRFSARRVPQHSKFCGHSFAVGIVASLVAVSTAAGCGGRGYAGLSQEAAVTKARTQMETLGLLLAGAASRSVGAGLVRRVKSTDPSVIKSHCGKKEVWKIVWQDVPAVFVGRGVGPVFGRGGPTVSMMREQQ